MFYGLNYVYCMIIIKNDLYGCYVCLYVCKCDSMIYMYFSKLYIYINKNYNMLAMNFYPAQSGE